MSSSDLEGERDPFAQTAMGWDWQPIAAGSSVTLYRVCHPDVEACYSCVVAACKSQECIDRQRQEFGEAFPGADDDPRDFDFCVESDS